MTKSNSPHKPDDIFAQEQTELSEFSFNQQVVDVFPDMINRSVPSYQQIVKGISKIANLLCPSRAVIYDLGCSLGTLSLAIAREMTEKVPYIKAIDNSSAMVDRCKQHVGAFSFGQLIDVQQGDLLDIELERCNMLVTNFTLQFIQPSERQKVINKIYNALQPGGVFVLSEKINLEDNVLDSYLVDLHHQFKRDNGYSELEISQKRTALENVMIVDSLATHFKRLNEAGFSRYSVWFQHYNFLSIIAIK